MDCLFLFTIGLLFFPLSHVLSTYFQKFIFPNIAYADRFSISTRFVSALQALAASAVGLKVAFSATDIMLHSQPLLTQYACFGLSYFYYDVVVMFIGGYLEEKHENPQRDLHYTYVWSKLYKRKKLIILHHLLLPIFGFPAITMWRRNKGDFFLACIYVNEMSTPFLSLKAIMEKLGMRKSTFYVANGVLLATVFLFCRVLIYPYMYWCYSRYTGFPFFSTPLRVPLFCNTFCLLLFSVQVYWFVIIMQGVLRFFQQPANVAQKTAISNLHLNGENGFLFKNHLMSEEGNCSEKSK